MDHITKDKRFAHIVKDPRFHKIPRKERKVKIDHRFKDMFTDEKFKLKCSVDKRGRTLKLSTNENLKRFYDISDESSSGSETDSDNDSSDDDRDSKKLLTKVDQISHGEENESSDSNDLDETGNEKHEETMVNRKDNKAEKSGSSDNEDLDESDNDRYEEPIRKGERKKGKKEKSNHKDQRSEKKIARNSHGMKLMKTEKSLKREQKEISDSETFDESDDDEYKEAIKEEKASKTKKQNSEIEDNRSKKEMAKTSTKTDQSKNLDNSDVNKDVKKKKRYRSKKKKNNSKKKKEKKVENNSGSDSDSSIDKNELLTKGEIDFARGEAEMSSTSEEDEDDNETDEDDGLVHNWADLDGNVEEVQEATSRLAICNLDWDRITSKDVFTVLNSFKPNNGFIRSVKIYMSEYGKERIEQERAEGPKELKAIEYEDENDEALMEDKTVKDSFTESLRQYQFNRLRYYYGVVDCDSVGTADHLYKECDGNEYETSCTKFDLRFIPEEMEFDESDMRSECGDIPHGYQPDYFKNYAMAFSKAELTWDETDRKRQQLVTQKFTQSVDDLKDDDLKAYLAESSDEEEVDYSKLIEQSDSGSEFDERETEDKQIDKYKKLLQDLDTEEKEKEKDDVQMEITWEMGLKETTEELVRKSQSSDKTVWEKYLDRKKEKKKEKRKDKKKKKDDEESDMEADEQQDGSFEAFSDDDVPDDLKDDPFFAEELNQTNSSKKKEKDKNKKKKKGKEEKTEEDENEKAALSLLMMDEDDNKKHFNLKNIIEADSQEGNKKKKKKKNKKTEDVKKDEDDFELNVQDPRFSAIYESHLYNIDPSAPEYKKTKGSEALVTEKLKRNTDPDSRKRAIKDKPYDSMKKMRLENTDHSKNESLASLVKSVKAKTKSFQNAKSFKDR